MSETVQLALITMIGPIITTVISHFLAGRKLNHITELSNSMLTQTKAEKDQAQKKLDENILTQLSAEKQKNAELEKQIALLTSPKGKE